MSLLDFPDVAQYKSLETSSYELIHQTLGQMSETNDYISPEPKADLENAVVVAQQYYLRGKLDNMDDIKLRNILQYIDDCKRLLELDKPAAPEAPAAEAPVDPNAPPAEPLPPPM
jgi:hypothetical protein